MHHRERWQNLEGNLRLCPEASWHVLVSTRLWLSLPVAGVFDECFNFLLAALLSVHFQFLFWVFAVLLLNAFLCLMKCLRLPCSFVGS